MRKVVTSIRRENRPGSGRGCAVVVPLPARGGGRGWPESSASMVDRWTSRNFCIESLELGHHPIQLAGTAGPRDEGKTAAAWSACRSCAGVLRASRCR